MFTGTDKGATWGPGLALLWPKGVIRVNLRAEGRFGVDDGRDFAFPGFVAPSAWFHLRIRLLEKEILVEASGDGRGFATAKKQKRRFNENTEYIQFKKIDNISDGYLFCNNCM